MEDVLELYEQPYDEQFPVVCVDERPCQLLADKQAPIEAEPGKPKREDFQYERNGICNLFVAFQPKQGWRHVEVTGGKRILIRYLPIRTAHCDFAPVHPQGILAISEGD